jgi:hypothetical protein
VAEQANDEGLWFLPQFITEAYFQERLRALHAVVEDKTMDEVVSELAAGNLTSPLPGEGFRCPHGERPSRICGQCVAKIRAEGFQKGYAQGLEDGQSRERIGLD